MRRVIGTWMGAWRVIVAIVVTEFLRVVRDRMALFFIVVLPVAIIVIVGVVFGSAPVRLGVGVVDQAGTQDSRRLVETIVAGDAFDLRHIDDTGTLEREIRTGQLMAGLVVTESSSGEQRVEILAPANSEMVPILKVAVDAASAGVVTTGVTTQTVGSTPLLAENQYAYTAPANLVLFVFINSVSAGVGMVESRRLGVTRRMLAAPVSPAMIVIGAGVNRMVFALAQSVLIIVVGTVLFGVHWGSLGAAAVLVVTWAALSAAAGLVVSAFANTPEQVNSFGIPIALGLSMLGGCMWPLELVGPTMDKVGHATPHAWAVGAWVELVFKGGGLGDIAVDLAVLVFITALLGSLAAWRLRRSLID